MDTQVWGPISYLDYVDLCEQGVNSECGFITPNYFDTVRRPLVLGRDFPDRNNADAPPVVIINWELVRRFYGSEQNALRKRFRFEQGIPLMEIIGIAKGGGYGTLYETSQLYLPVYQHPRIALTLLIRAQSAGALPAVTESPCCEIAQLGARMPVRNESVQIKEIYARK